MNILEELRKNFKKNGITLKDDADSIKQYTMQDSVTNQFMKVVDTRGKPYLVRINGKLWPPFTREGEHYNLNKLEEKSIASGVLVNNTLMGFQICNFYSEDQRFSKMPGESQEKYLKNIASTIKQFHQIPYFKNEYSISSTIYNTLKRLSSTQQDKFSPFYKVILSLLTTLNADKENYVASHNDLLPSSIYINEEGITIVDWEYSAMNHCSYDLSLLSIKSSFTPEQEQSLVENYNSGKTKDLSYSVAMMKPIVNFLLLLWHSTSKNPDIFTANLLLSTLTAGLENVIYKQTTRMLGAELRFGFFSKGAIMRSTQTETSRITDQNNFRQ